MYRDRYSDVEEKNATLLAISSDDDFKQAQWKASLGASYSFIADEQGELIRLFKVKMPLITVAKRVTYVVGEGRKILHVERGSHAIDPSEAIAACPLFVS